MGKEENRWFERANSATKSGKQTSGKLKAVVTVLLRSELEGYSAQFSPFS